MDSEIKLNVLNSSMIPSFGMIIEMDNVANGIAKKGVLKSVASNLFWEVQSRVIEYSAEKRFDNEDEIIVHINKTNPTKDASLILKQREEKNIRSYKIIPIGHQLKPIKGEELVFHATTFWKKIQIIAIADDYFLLEDPVSNYKAVIPKRKVVRSATAKVGDFVRHCEHQFHDLVDANDAFIYRYPKQ
jgi:hypothetical protein